MPMEMDVKAMQGAWCRGRGGDVASDDLVDHDGRLLEGGWGYSLLHCLGFAGLLAIFCQSGHASPS